MKNLVLHDIDGYKFYIDSENIDYTCEKRTGLQHGLQANVYLKSGRMLEVRESCADIQRLREAPDEKVQQ